MRLLKRLQTTVITGFDTIISQVENHEAIVDAAIRETQEAERKAHIQLQRVRRDTVAMTKRIGELEKEEVEWGRRAIQVPPEEEVKALECVRRRRLARREREHLTDEVAGHHALDRQLTADLKKVSERIHALRRRKHTLSAREFRTRAVEASELETHGIIHDIDDIFERWESKLADRDPYASSEYDTFESEFVHEEEAQDVKDELTRLRADKGMRPQPGVSGNHEQDKEPT